MLFNRSSCLLAVILWAGLFLAIGCSPAAPTSTTSALVAGALFDLGLVLGAATLFVLRLALGAVFRLFFRLLPGAALLPWLVLWLVLLLAVALVLVLLPFARGPAAGRRFAAIAAGFRNGFFLFFFGLLRRVGKYAGEQALDKTRFVFVLLGLRGLLWCR